MIKNKAKIEKEHGRKLTNRQMTFAKFIVEGIYSNAECGRKAGYAHNIAKTKASILLNGRDYPHLNDYISYHLERRMPDNFLLRSTLKRSARHWEV